VRVGGLDDLAEELEPRGVRVGEVGHGVGAVVLVVVDGVELEQRGRGGGWATPPAAFIHGARGWRRRSSPLSHFASHA
jgi:hypothetical protein